MPRSEAELLAYLDEALAPELASEIEQELRNSPASRQQLIALLERRDQGGHTLGEIWRRRQLSCPSRTDLARYMNGQTTGPERDYLEFHLGIIQCPVCEANLEDLRQLSQGQTDEQDHRRRKIFESSAGRLRRSE